MAVKPGNRAARGDQKDGRRQPDRAGTGFGDERRLDLAGDRLAGRLGPARIRPAQILLLR
jgi:hypothetical protein